MQKNLREKVFDDVKMKGVYTCTIRDEATGRIKRTMVFENIVPIVGRTMIANNLASASPTNVMKITHCALGTSATTPANGDTQLGTEVYRNAINSLTNAANVVYAGGYFTAVETFGTYAEAGIFCNGSGTVNSGILLSHVLLAITKANTETLTIDWVLTIS